MVVPLDLLLEEVMGISEVRSPINRRSGDMPLNPGANAQRRGDDSVPNQPKHTAAPVKSHSEKPGGGAKVTGPDV